MSQSRAVASAQKRRNAPMEYPPQQPKGPNTSIHSSQIFSQQSQGNIPGKGMRPQQYQQQQQNMYQQQPQVAEQSSKTGQMTIPQAITLITLRLGKVESQLQRMSLEKPEYDASFIESTNDNKTIIDKSQLQTILSRLESLEKRSTLNPGATAAAPGAAGSSADIQNLKAQIEALKPIISGTKNLTMAQKKELVDLKSEVESLRSFFSETSNLIHQLQYQSNDLNQKVVQLETAYSMNNDFGGNEAVDMGTDISTINDMNFELQNFNDDNILEVHDNTMVLDITN